VTVLGVALIVVVLFGLLREGAMRLMARLGGLSVRHRAWELAFPLSIGVALAFGVFFAAPGSVYPARVRGATGTFSAMGSIAFAGASAVLVLTWTTWALARFGGPPPGGSAWLRVAHLAGLMLVTVDVLLPFFPFASFDGRRRWDLNRTSWGALAAVLGLILVTG
jgi:hypothetical protein